MSLHFVYPSSSSSSSSSSCSSTASSSSSASTYRIPFKIRDFTYALRDPRHQGLGEDGQGKLNVPRENRLGAIYKALLDEAAYKAWKAAADPERDSADSDESEEEMDDGFGEVEEEFDEENEGEEEEWSELEEEGNDSEDPGPLSPGLYRALYAFEPEGSKEMALKEEQVVRVVGRGGGVGWAVVVVDGVDEHGNKRLSQKDRQLALVPESYLEPIVLDEEETS